MTKVSFVIAAKAMKGMYLLKCEVAEQTPISGVTSEGYKRKLLSVQ